MELNKSKTSLEQKYWDICSEVVAQNNLKLYDVEYVASSSTLRVFIYDEATKTAVLDDCVRVDRAMTPYLEEDWVADNLVLEVSSPGMFRPLKSWEHFQLANGEMVLCVLHSQVEGVKGNKARGKLLGINDKIINLEIDGKEVSLPVEQVKKANLDPDY